MNKESLSYLFVYFCSAFNFSHNHPHDATVESSGQRKELLVRRDVMIPGVRIPELAERKKKVSYINTINIYGLPNQISDDDADVLLTDTVIQNSKMYDLKKGTNVLDGEPVSTENFNAVYVILAQETELDFAERSGGNHVSHSHLKQAINN